MKLSLINKIQSKESLGLFRQLEITSDVFITPARLLFGRTYATYTARSVHLKSPEDLSWSKRIGQMIAITLFPLSILSTFFGLVLKKIALLCSPHLADKYAFADPIINARNRLNFDGKLPPNPLTPNCVNSQQSSLWGNLYNVKSIEVPKHILPSQSIQKMDQVITNLTKDPSSDLVAKQTEKEGSYRHYECLVKIPGLGIFIDDLDFWYDEQKHVIDVRSASRVGFRDALSFNFSNPGANKSRVEQIREAFKEYIQEQISI
ncbi:MAG: hypothetical protein S4CHLAM123_10730 [Chlamydiales bacterium]|nr:hypothetical protein [Chlamydiales bacterium]